MSRYDGLIIPRSYSEYINKTDAATLLQALQLSGVMDNAPTANSNHPVKSSGILNAINNFIPKALLQMYNNATRPTSANGVVDNNKISVMLATTNMTEGKPTADGYIISLGWDKDTYASQLYLPNYNIGKIAFRNHQPSGWGDWQYFEQAIYENLTVSNILPQLEYNGNSQICCVKNGVFFLNITFITKTAFTLNSRVVIANVPKRINGGNVMLECSVKNADKFSYLRTTSSVANMSDIVYASDNIALAVGVEISIRCAIPII